MEIIKFLQAFQTPLLDKFFIFSTMFGEESIYIIILGVIYWCFNKRFAYKLAFAFLFNGAVNGALKSIIAAPRPIDLPDIFHLRVETATGYSFPSGHTQSATAFWATVILKERKLWAYILGTIITLLVAVSRLYLGVHWPQDVAGGILFGIVCASISSLLFDYSVKRENKCILLILVIPSLLGLFLFKGASDYVKAVAVVCSFYIGYVVEDRYINFSENCNNTRKLFRIVIGLGGILIIKTLIKGILPEVPLSDFFRYFLIGIWTTILAPFLFIIFNLDTVKKTLRTKKA